MSKLFLSNQNTGHHWLLLYAHRHTENKQNFNFYSQEESHTGLEKKKKSYNYEFITEIKC